MAGRARLVFTAHAEAAGLEPPPTGALASYAEEEVLAQIPALRARCGDDDEEKLHHLQEMETAAQDLLTWIADKPARRPSRAARGAPAPAAAPTPAQRASTRTATVRDRYRRRRMQ